MKAPRGLAIGDIIEIQDVGAYAATQHLEFLNKRPAPEVIIDENNKALLVTKRGSFTDKTRNTLLKPKDL